MKCWGKNLAGQLGNDGAASGPSAVDVVGLRRMWVPGDVDCDGAVTSIDALLLLQYDASLSRSLPCAGNADTDADGAVGAKDAAIILQQTAKRSY
jgi:hypothetical protein